MLDLALIRAEPARVRAAMARRGLGPDAVDAVLELDGRWTARQQVREALRIRRRQISGEVARRKATLRTGPDWDADPYHAPDLVAAGREVAHELHAVESEMAHLAARRDAALLALPNLPSTDVPDKAAPVPAGAPPWPQDFPPLAHRDLVEMLGLAHTAASAGRGFLVWRGPGAHLVRGLVRLMLDVHVRDGGCEEVLAPSLATRAALVGSAHLPALEEKMYHVEGPDAGHDLFLAPRAEPHLAGLCAGMVLDEAALPVRLVAAGRAFRRSVGSHGSGKRGLLRLHEFPTVEVYTVCRPDRVEAELARAVRSAETVLARLGLACRRTLRPAPRLSHAAARTVDLAAWAPGTGRWLDLAAISCFTDYQARRTHTRYRDTRGRTRLVHTVGGAAVALPRLIAAILENGQQADGTVRLPEALTPYTEEAILRAPG